MKIKLINNKSDIYFLIGLFFIAIVKTFSSVFIPLNILPNANLDDALFFRLAENISKGNWLGVYENSTLIKGFFYPFFLAVSIKLQIPLRVLESSLICISSMYFIYLFKGIFTRTLLVLLFSILVFYPYQYGVVDFRILRDMIYPQLLLIIFTASLFLLSSALNNHRLSRINYLHILILSTSLFLFINTREEAVWIFPSMLLILGILFYKFYKNNYFLYFIKLLFCGFFVFIALTILQFSIQEKYYQSSIVNIWKDKRFQSGFSSLQRLSIDNKKFDYISSSNWEAFFKISPSIAALKPFIKSPVYENWMPISCNTLSSLGYDMEKDSGCPNEVVSGYILFALNDVLWAYGKRTPEQIAEFMQIISDDIESGCNDKKIECNFKPPSVLPAQIAVANIKFSELIDLFISGISSVFNFHNPEFKNYFIDHDVQKVMKIRASLRGRLFDIGKENFKIYPANGNDEARLNIIKGDYGYLDDVQYRGRELILSGSFYSLPKDISQSVEIYINGNIACVTSHFNFKIQKDKTTDNKAKFECIAPFEFENSDPIALSAYLVDHATNIRYRLKNNYLVDIALSNKFNEDCYLFSNLDIKYYVDKGHFTASDHYQSYGIFENRLCSPLFSTKIAQNKFKDDIARYSEKGSPFIGELFELNSQIYFYFIKVMPFIFLILFLVPMLRVNLNQLVLYALSIFLCLFLSRVCLITLFSYLGIAPISALYLASGYFSLFVAGALSFIALLSSLNKYLALRTS